MIRTQIQLTEQQYAALKVKAAVEGVSLATVIRRGVDLLLREAPDKDKKTRKQQALSIAGQFHSGLSDLSSKHDRYLAEAYGDNS